MDKVSIDNHNAAGPELLLRVRGLRTTFLSAKGVVKAVNGLNFDLMEGERLAFVGESGCGKSVLAQTILRLLPENARISGKILFRKLDLLGLDGEEMVDIRGREIGFIPQQLSSLDPLMKVGGQIREALLPNAGLLNRTPLSRKIFDLLRLAGLEQHVSERYPHQLSGGMNRRALISMGIAPKPTLLIADEPTTGLDTILRKRTVRLIDRITDGSSLLLITHDIETARICENIAVMYAGEIVEAGPTSDILNDPHHPYTKGLMASMPSRGMSSISGMSPSLINLPQGCRFHPRCPDAKERCAKQHPDFRGTGRGVRCHYAYS